MGIIGGLAEDLFVVVPREQGQAGEVKKGELQKDLQKELHLELHLELLEPVPLQITLETG